jgi:uncharacterized membrane protein HdeD (DUF308 family)
MTIADYARQIPDELVAAVRSMMIVTSIVGIVLGIIALVWPAATLFVIGILFGISLIVAGLFRLYTAFASSLLSGGWRFVLGLIGALILIAGIIALFNPEESLLFLAIFIGVGWIFQGVADLSHAVAGSLHTPRWLLVLSGVVAIVAGIVMLFIPGLALATFLWVAAIMLIVVSVVTLFTLPKKVDQPV